MLSILTSLPGLFALFSIPITVVLTKLLIILFAKLNIVDKPDGIRKLHKKPTPTGAGIIFVFLITPAMFRLISAGGLYSIYSITFVLAFILISLVSFFDDTRRVPIIVRLITHIICASIMSFFFYKLIQSIYPLNLHDFELYSMPFIIGYLIFIGAFVGYINIYNFLDGMDGLTLAQSIHLSITALLLIYFYQGLIPTSEVLEFPLWIVLSASLGMLYYNLPPAKIFLGDVGSISLGFIFGCCYFSLSLLSIELFIASIIANLYYIADGFGTILIRIYNKEKIWQAHFKHFFQKAISKGKDVKTILKTVVICNVTLMFFSILSLYQPLLALLLSIVSVTITIRRLTN